MKKKYPRIVERIKASLGGFFWLPCPICGDDFGGHEWEVGHSLMISHFSGKGVCPDCGEEAAKRNEQFFKDNPEPTQRRRVIDNG